MGQQQILLIILAVIIVSIAIVVGINTFQNTQMNANRDAVTADLVGLAAKAQQFYIRPLSLGGGEQNFQNFSLAANEYQNGNGRFRLFTDSTAAGTPHTLATIPAYADITTSSTYIYIAGYGTATNGTNLVQTMVSVGATGLVLTTKIN
jgi:Tfp pilus assembly protein PilE